MAAAKRAKRAALARWCFWRRCRCIFPACTAFAGRMDARKRGAWLFDAGDDAFGHFYESDAYHVRRKRHCVRRPGYGPDAQPAGACVQRNAGQVAGLIPGKPCVLRAVAHPHGGGAEHLWRGKRGLCGLHGAGRAVHTVFAHPAGRADRLAGGLCRRAAAPQGAGGQAFCMWRCLAC